MRSSGSNVNTTRKVVSLQNPCGTAEKPFAELRRFLTSTATRLQAQRQSRMGPHTPRSWSTKMMRVGIGRERLSDMPKARMNSEGESVILTSDVTEHSPAV